MSSSKVQIIFGGARVSPNRGFDDVHAAQEAFDILREFGVDTIDTSRGYGSSESILGNAGAARWFQLHTKVPGGLQPGSLRKAEMAESLATSLRELRTDAVEVFYFHTPDPSTPLEQALDNMNDLHQKGLFSGFGLSNFLARDVQRAYEYCRSQGYVLPTVYQGNFNPLVRDAEDGLLPTLRRLGIAFHAYSPIAGGLLAKTKDQVVRGSGRFVEGSAYWKQYVNETNLDALAQWAAIATEAQCHPAELAYRWIRYHSSLRGDLGDALIFGANGTDQLRQTLRWLESGPISELACQRVDQVWDKVKSADPLCNIYS